MSERAEDDVDLAVNWTASAICELQWQGLPGPTVHFLDPEQDRSFIEDVLLGRLGRSLVPDPELLELVANRARADRSASHLVDAHAVSLSIILSAATVGGGTDLPLPHGRRVFRFDGPGMADRRLRTGLRFIASGLDGDPLADRAVSELMALGFLVPEENLPRRVVVPPLEILICGAERSKPVAHARREYDELGFFTLRGIVRPSAATALGRYFEELHAQGLFSTLVEEDRKKVIYNEPALISCHADFGELLGSVVGEPFKPTYVFTARYEEHADLAEHIDRPQCEWNMSVLLQDTGQAENTHLAPWPLFIKTDGRRHTVHLGLGDAVVYRGTRMPHGRPSLTGAGRAVTVGIFHFVTSSYRGGFS